MKLSPLLLPIALAALAPHADAKSGHYATPAMGRYHVGPDSTYEPRGIRSHRSLHAHDRLVSRNPSVNPFEQADERELIEEMQKREAMELEERSKNWSLKQTIAGKDFWNHWYYGTDKGANGGLAHYLGKDEAFAHNLLVNNNDGSVTIRVDTTPTVSQYRRATNMFSTFKFYMGNMVIFDATHMPTGCGSWPALWTVGSGTWPQGGEIDIIEGVNEFKQNAISIHTKSGCWIPSSGDYTAKFMDSDPSSRNNCAAKETNDEGCGMRDPQPDSYGSAFNKQGGGVYALVWRTTSIKVYFFPRDKIPADISKGHPNPNSWGKPRMSFSSQKCNFHNFFTPQQLVLSNNIAGTWVDGVWDSAASYAGQEKSCSALTSHTVKEHVLAEGASFSNAYWRINSIKIYE